jgi:ABC-type dipeptide/oligopeptide/nickel transport system permease component
MSSFSYWIELVLILIFAQYVLKLSGKRTDHNTVKQVLSNMKMMTLCVKAMAMTMVSHVVYQR